MGEETQQSWLLPPAGSLDPSAAVHSSSLPWLLWLLLLSLGHTSNQVQGWSLVKDYSWVCCKDRSSDGHSLTTPRGQICFSITACWNGSLPQRCHKDR